MRGAAAATPTHHERTAAEGRVGGRAGDANVIAEPHRHHVRRAPIARKNTRGGEKALRDGDRADVHRIRTMPLRAVVEQVVVRRVGRAPERDLPEWLPLHVLEAANTQAIARIQPPQRWLRVREDVDNKVSRPLRRRRRGQKDREQENAGSLHLPLLSTLYSLLSTRSVIRHDE